MHLEVSFYMCIQLFEIIFDHITLNSNYTSRIIQCTTLKFSAHLLNELFL